MRFSRFAIEDTEFVKQVSVAPTRDEDVEGPAEEVDDGVAHCHHGSWWGKGRRTA